MVLTRLLHVQVERLLRLALPPMLLEDISLRMVSGWHLGILGLDLLCEPPEEVECLTVLLDVGPQLLCLPEQVSDLHLLLVALEQPE